MFSLSLHSFPSRGGPTTHRGFGLIELLVSVSIMLLLAGLVFARHQSFNGAVLLRSEAYEIALSIREVQFTAVSAESDGGGDFRSVEGVYITSADDDSYKIFRDLDGDKYYDTNEQYGKQGTIDNRFEIRAVRGVGDSVGSDVAIVFERPNFDARFYDENGPVNASSIEIDIAKRGDTGTSDEVVRTVEVTATGQISVKQTP